MNRRFLMLMSQSSSCQYVIFQQDDEMIWHFASLWGVCAVNPSILIFKDNMPRTWSANISAAIFHLQYSFTVFYVLSVCPLYVWEERITGCCHWALIGNLKQAWFIIDFPSPLCVVPHLNGGKTRQITCPYLILCPSLTLARRRKNEGL